MTQQRLQNILANTHYKETQHILVELHKLVNFTPLNLFLIKFIFGENYSFLGHGFYMKRNQKKIIFLVSLCSGTGPRKKIIIYRPNEFEFVNWVLVKQKNLGGLRHDLHMCQISDYFQNGRFSQWGSEQKIWDFSKYRHIIYHLKTFYAD